MSLEEVHAGMTGYGLSVFNGTKIERFNVEVLSVLRNFNPKHDVILVRCSGANLEHTGSIAGMSGSPVFLRDEQGRDRMIGAFAYGWPMMKDPIGGVQPIEYMLSLATQPTTQPAARPVPPDVNGAAAGEKSALRWRVDQVLPVPWVRSPVAPAGYPFANWNTTTPNPRLSVDDGEVARLRPLATPLMTAGLAPRLLNQLKPVYEAYGLMPMQAGMSGGSGDADAPGTQPADVKLEPGSVLAVPLLIGDVDMTAIGTCTEVLDGRVFGFGHPFMSEGSVNLPMGSGQIQGVIANLVTSFKLGSLARNTGSIYTDELTGVAGRMGPAAPMVPITLRVRYTDGSLDDVYHFKAASHPRFTPLLAISAINAAVTGEHDLPQFHTMDYDLKATFENGQVIDLKNTAVNSNPGELFFELGGPMIAAAENPFERVLVKDISGSVTVRPEAREARILSVNVPRLKHRPGETVKAYVSYRPFRAAEATMPIEFVLPRDLPEGTYQLTISDWMQYLAEEQAAKPFRFTAENIDEVFEVMRDLGSVRHDAVYIRLNRQPDGVAVGRTAMPNLPSSRREVLIGAGRSNVTAFVSATVHSVPTPYVMSGSAQFQITIDKNAKVERAGASKPEPGEAGEEAGKGGKGKTGTPAPGGNGTPNGETPKGEGPKGEKGDSPKEAPRDEKPAPSAQVPEHKEEGVR